MPCTAGLHWTLKPKYEKIPVFDDNGEVIFIDQPVKDSAGNIIYEKEFKKSIMLKHEQTSFEAVQWINYQEAIFRRDFNDPTLRIEQAYFRGEKDYYGLKPDGYLKIGENLEYFFEYQGCHVHPDCPHKCGTELILSGNNLEKRRETWNQKKMRFDDQPRRNLIVKRSCEWKVEKHALVTDTLPPTSMARVLNRDTVETLLKAVKDE